MEAMDKPLCQFGPGGDFSTVYPAGAAKPLSETKKAQNPRGWAKLAQDLGFELPLVSVGPAGLMWQKKKASHLKGVVGSLLEVLRRVRPEDGVAADEKLLASQIALADEALARLTMKDSQVLQAASAELSDVAMPAAETASARVSADGDFALSQASRPDQKEKTNEAYASDTEEAGDSEIYSGFSRGEWLFPDNAGDRRPFESNKSDSLRTRRRTGTKRSASAGRKAQRSLFAGIQ